MPCIIYKASVGYSHLWDTTDHGSQMAFHDTNSLKCTYDFFVHWAAFDNLAGEDKASKVELYRNPLPKCRTLIIFNIMGALLTSSGLMRLKAWAFRQTLKIQSRAASSRWTCIHQYPQWVWCIFLICNATLMVAFHPVVKQVTKVFESFSHSPAVEWPATIWCKIMIILATSKQDAKYVNHATWSSHCAHLNFVVFLRVGLFNDTFCLPRLRCHTILISKIYVLPRGMSPCQLLCAFLSDAIQSAPFNGHHRHHRGFMRKNFSERQISSGSDDDIMYRVAYLFHHATRAWDSSISKGSWRISYKLV